MRVLTGKADALVAASDFKLLFESAPCRFLVLQPDAPRFTIVAASEAFVLEIGLRREDLLGKGIFEVFPEDPGDPPGHGVANTRESLERVMSDKVEVSMPPPRLAMRRPDDKQGNEEDRWWRSSNSPALDATGAVAYIIHRLEDVTELVRLSRPRAPARVQPDDLLSLTARMEAQGYLQALKTSEAAHLRSNEAHEAAARELERAVAARTLELDQASAALNLSEARLREIFDSATDAILTADESHHIVMANAATATMFRCSIAELIGAPLERLMPVRHREKHRLDFDAFGDALSAARHMGRTRYVVGLRADGTEFLVDAAISYLSIDGHKLYTAIMRDVSDRLEAEQTLLAGKAKLEAALSSMSDSVFISDNEGRFLELNDAFATFHRFKSRDDCPQRVVDYPAILEMTFPDGTPAPPGQWPVPRALRGEAASNVEYGLRRKDTGESWIGSYTFAPISSAEGAIVGAVVTARDITEIKVAQAELARSHEDLRLLVAAQDRIQEEERKRIARELHDDLQQTLAVIRIDLSAIADRLETDPTRIGPLVSEVDRLALAAIVSTRRIVNDLRPEMLEDLGLVPALEAMVARFAERAGLSCALYAAADVGEALRQSSAGATCLYRVTQEALNNIAKHAHAAVVKVSLQRAGPAHVVLRISDDGIGMNADDKRSPSSFGLLGMAERVRALGGTLTIASKPGEGTTIDAVVPLFGAPAAPPSAAGGIDRPPLAGSPQQPDNPVAGKRERGAEPAQPLQSVFDALEGSVAVLDRAGTILTVNRDWREFARHAADPGLRGGEPGAAYPDVCRRSASARPQTLPAVRGLSEVLAGASDVFIFEYPCDTIAGTTWLRMHVASVKGGIVIVTHVDISSRIDKAPPPPPAEEHAAR